jgi:hypothetical protein
MLVDHDEEDSRSEAAMAGQIRSACPLMPGDTTRTVRTGIPGQTTEIDILG